MLHLVLNQPIKIHFFKTMKIKHILSSIALTASAVVQAQYTDVINSNRPGQSQSAFAVGKSVIQVESGINGFHEKHNLLGTESGGAFADLNLRWGLFLEQLELNGKIQYQADEYLTALGSENRSGIKSASLGFKYLIYDPYKYYEDKVNVYSWKANHRFKWHQLIPAVSAFAGANYNPEYPYAYQIDQKISPKAALITQNQFSGNWVLVLNFIADNITSSTPTYAYIATLTKGFNQRWSGFIENQGIKSDYYSDAILRGGAAYLINKNLQVDASISTNFKDTPSVLYGGAGVSWRFDKYYKPVKLEPKKKGKDAKNYKTKK